MDGAFATGEADWIERTAKGAGVSMRQVLIAADVNYSTWMRWKHGADPKLSTLDRVRAALTQLTGVP